MEPQGPDRNALIGVLLISLILGAWLLFFSPRTQPPPTEPAEAAGVEEPEAADPEEDEAIAPPTDSTFAGALAGTPRLIHVETDRYVATFSTRGGTLVSMRLKNYRRAGSDEPVDLVQNGEEGALALEFNPARGPLVDTRTLYFRPSASAGALEGDTLRVGEGGAQLVFDAPVGGGALRLVYAFEPDRYEVGLNVSTPGSDVLAHSGGYELTWDGAIPLVEHDPQEEVTNSGAYVRWGGETNRIQLTEAGEAEPIPATGRVEWVAVKTKYFIAAMIPQEGTETEGAELGGERTGDPTEPGFEEHFTARLELPEQDSTETAAFLLYLGPMELNRLSAYGLYDTVEFGFGQSLTRPIARYVVAPAFAFLSTFLPSYGLVIILFALLVKIVLWPLTASSMRSAARMRELGPKVEALKERYADDPQQQQQAMMQLYREAGVNPLGGCLPMLLQYPLLIALWRFFNSTLVLRQEAFLWAPDLSAPDVILRLPFAIPWYGDFVAGFTLLMGVSMILQMRLSMPAGGQTQQNKMLMYMLPAVFFLFFNRLPSGLSLYYLAFNVFSIAQQQWVNRHTPPQGVGEAKVGRGQIRPAGVVARHNEAAAGRARSNGHAKPTKKTRRS